MDAAAYLPHDQATVSSKQQPSTRQSRESEDLLLLATDRFCVQGNYNRLTQDQYCEAFGLLYDQASTGTKQIIARSLAFHPFAPRSIIYRLSLEPLAISRAVLKESPVLGQLDLLRLLETRGLEIASVIASRTGLGPSLIKRLRHLQDQHVDEALSQNASLAHGEHLDLGSLFETLAPRAQTTKTTAAVDAEIEASAAPANKVHAIISDLEDELAYTKQTKQTKQTEPQATKIAASETVVAATPVVSEPKTSTPVLSGAQRALIEAASRGARLEPTNAIVEAVAASAKPTHAEDTKTETPSASADVEAIQSEEFAAALQKAASRGNRQAMVQVMQSHFGLSVETCNQVFEDNDGDTFSVLLKSAGVPSAAANRILLLVFPAIGLSVQNAARSIRYYSQLDQKACLDAVEQWPKTVSVLPVDASATKPAQHAPYSADTDGHLRAGLSAYTRASERHAAELKEAI